MGKILFAAYRLPQTLEISESDELKLSNPTDNNILNASVDHLREKGQEVLWIGACNSPEHLRDSIRTKLKDISCVPVFVERGVAKDHFSVFCKGVVWPLFHYNAAGSDHYYTKDAWKAYQNINQLFADEIIKNHKEGDIIMIHDYHLMLVPLMVRTAIHKAKIGFFLHIPWPTSELYRSLPVRDSVLDGLFGSDVIGFQTFPYTRHFLSAVTRISGLSANEKGVELSTDIRTSSGGHGRFVKMLVNPVGIDAMKFKKALESPEIIQKISDMKKTFRNQKIIVARDTMEYIHGIPHKLRMFGAFLKAYPEWREKVVLYQECIPNAEVLNERNYKLLNEEIEKLVGSINGDYSTLEYKPIVYLNRRPKWEDVISLLAVADVCLVTALRDGMNTTSYEFIACQEEKKSPIVLSEFAGSANCLPGAIIVNPWDQKKCIETLNEALTMSDEHKKLRYTHNRDYVFAHSSAFWIDNFLKSLHDPVDYNKTKITRINFKDTIASYKKSSKRLFLLDYDGTLTPIVRVPNLAVPTEELLTTLITLSQNPKNIVYVITGRERKTMDEWLSGIAIGMSCEHGSFFRQFKRNEIAKWYNCTEELDLSWKPAIKTILEDYAERTPGSSIENKEIGISWHYRNADAEFAEYQKKELIQHLKDLPNLPVDILAGKKVVEVRPQGVSKGSVVRRILNNEQGIDFVLSIGDDKTDEEMFEEINKKEMNATKITVTVEKKPSVANFYSDNQRHVIDLLTKLAYA